MTFGWTAPFIPYLESNDSHITATKGQLKWLETGFLMGSFFGLPFTALLVDKIGRKKSLLLASAVILAAWTIIALANRIEYIIVARFLCGMSGNMAFVAAPMYVAEIADQKIRGFLASIISIYMLTGNLIVYCVGPFLPFYTPCAIGITVALIELIVFSTVHDSPTYLMSKNRIEAATKSMQYFKPKSDHEYELQILSEFLEDQKAQKGNIKDLFLEPSNIKCMLIMTVLNIGQHFGAYSVILMNMHKIIDRTGSMYMDSAYIAILFAALMLIAAIVASSQIDKFGRKVLLVVSCTLTGTCLLAISMYFHAQHLGYDVLLVSWIPIVSIMVYAVAFKMGIGLVPLVITSEIFPTNVKALGMTMADSMFIIGGIIAIQVYQALEHYGLYIPFYIFTFCSFFVVLFTIFYIPETKGKTLEEIQELLRGRERIKRKTQTLPTPIEISKV